MAAAKALLSAVATARAKTNTTLLKKSTATEHARSSTGDVSRLPLTGLQGSDSENGFVLNDNDLEKIVSLLLWLAKDSQSSIHIDDIHYAALEVILKHADAAASGTRSSPQNFRSSLICVDLV